MFQERLCLLIGPDEFARQEALQALTQQVLEPEWAEFNLEKFDAAHPVSAVLDGWLTPPLWGERRLLVAELSGDPLASLLEALANVCNARLPDTPNLLVISAPSIDKRRKESKALLKLASLQEFQEIKPWTALKVLQPWLEDQARQRGKRIDRLASEYLIAACGTDKYLLQQQLEKVVTYLGSEPQITREVLEKLVPATESDIFALLEILAKRQTAELFQHFHNLMLREPAPKIMSTLATLIIRLFKARWYREKGFSYQDIAAQLKQHPFVVEKDLKRWSHLGARQLETGMNRLLELQTQSRSSRLTPELALEIWLREMLAL